jgi:hypothetical protein
MRKLALAIAAVGAISAASVVPAEARWGDWHGGWGPAIGFGLFAGAYLSVLQPPPPLTTTAAITELDLTGTTVEGPTPTIVGRCITGRDTIAPLVSMS